MGKLKYNIRRGFWGMLGCLVGRWCAHRLAVRVLRAPIPGATGYAKHITREQAEATFRGKANAANEPSSEAE
jgi:hypothetical protein